MKICATIAEARAACHPIRTSQQIPGTRAYHGCAPCRVICRWCVRPRRNAMSVAVSIFVNPTQFGPSRRPRRSIRGSSIVIAVCSKKKASIFCLRPRLRRCIRSDTVSWVTVEVLSDKLDGRSRPGHFRGVTHGCREALSHHRASDAPFFGQKDAAQLAVIRRMVRDLNFPVEIVACPIVREPDGLAMSSRNAYLNPEERAARSGAASLVAGRAAGVSSGREQFCRTDLGRQARSRRRTQSGSRLLRDCRSGHSRSGRANFKTSPGRGGRARRCNPTHRQSRHRRVTETHV